jgi:hypothetical protein
LHEAAAMRLAVVSEIKSLLSEPKNIIIPDDVQRSARNIVSTAAIDIQYYTKQGPRILPRLPQPIDSATLNAFIDLTIGEGRSRSTLQLVNGFADQLNSLREQYRSSWYNLRSDKFATLFPDPLVRANR